MTLVCGSVCRMAGQALKGRSHHVIGQPERDVIPGVEVIGHVVSRELRIVPEPVECGLRLAAARRTGDGNIITLLKVCGR